jgi:glycosyltransferase involved in cell wall biosynthesis
MTMSAIPGAAGEAPIERKPFTGVLRPGIKSRATADLLRNATFCCMPSRYEGWNIVAMETAASSKAALGTDIQGLRDTIKNGITGILVPPDDAFLLAEKMSLLLGDAALRERLGKNGYVWAKRFSWNRVTGLQEAFYGEVVKWRCTGKVPS